MSRGILALALAGLGSVVVGVGCSTSPGPEVTSQLEFNLTVNEDRARFVEDGLEYQGSVGPYAVYKVTGENPRLVGPYIKVSQQVGYAMLCGATHYFTPSLAQARMATLRLQGGHTGALQLVTTDQAPIDSGACTQAKDTFGNPIPPGGDTSGGGTTGGGTTGGGTTGGGTTGGGTTGGGTGNPGTTGGGTTGCDNPDGCPGGGGTTTGGGGNTGTTGSGTTGSGGATGNPGTTGGGTVPCDNPDGCNTGTGTGTTGTGGTGNPGTTGGGTVPCDNPDPAACNPTSGSTSGSGGAGAIPTYDQGTVSDPTIQRISVTFNNPPKVGSTVLLRRVALTGARQHNLSHLIPNICCVGAQCSLQQIQ